MSLSQEERNLQCFGYFFAEAMGLLGDQLTPGDYRDYFRIPGLSFPGLMQRMLPTMTPEIHERIGIVVNMLHLEEDTMSRQCTVPEQGLIMTAAYDYSCYLEDKCRSKSVEEAQVMLGVSRQDILELIEQNTLGALMVDGEWRVFARQLEMRAKKEMQC